MGKIIIHNTTVLDDAEAIRRVQLVFANGNCGINGAKLLSRKSYMEITLYKQKPITSRVKLLNEKLGGNWAYNNKSGQWDCDDGRCVRYTVPPEEGLQPDCWIDHPNEPTKRFCFYELLNG